MTLTYRSIFNVGCLFLFRLALVFLERQKKAERMFTDLWYVLPERR